ncbi:UDP-N-acetylmuramate--alanine ligase [Marinitoga sp. 1135]|uniref:UDP-N-acetylmuramate--L-alanine ligase n=1 Tax=Marinitoga piezophila (strain DSM 14283 / JCM 11233 / KA3) TaxID=443254 RepID=H2J854_MARPK|nr:MULTISPECIES: UDP-N-acetylmuramate--L-alanine ligase [Marinitoga]AEX85545.1 UDP-N-acetylmuramate--alanine ligase [Marinitoga piezophila KA3]APT76018.1 UDP-N-acetylmuramate--alanine ligase [Marinitoga sp. 1137]NUU95760.1 UDP-N-acetylmuramate--alanine ligase [Marinitoga sp. 1135]NUU97682.1 UDP-N-acetylmuramate--alanine ligase [Marinitoga sp. 1138]
MKYFFSGIGGIGMSSLALYTKYKGYDVAGSNNANSERTQYLKNKDIDISIGHSEENVKDADLVIKSTAIKSDNPEILYAQKNNITILNRMEYLNYILKTNYSIGITGTDGKTTTTAMISHILKESGCNPTVFLGGIHDNLEDGNFRMGTGPIISEVDESDGFIRNTITDVSIITNLRPDHLEHYNNSFENLIDSIYTHASHAKDFVLLNGDDSILNVFNDNLVVSFGSDDKSDYYFFNRQPHGYYQTFEVNYKNKYVGMIKINLPGIHYAYDAIAAVAYALEHGISFEKIQKALETFNSVNRRFNVLFKNSHIFVVDDYAHTPEEVEYTIKAAKEYFPDFPIIAIFQPHRYTRLFRNYKKFSQVLENADKVFVYRIYSAFEDPIDGVDERKMAKLITDSEFVDSENEMIDRILDIENGVFLFLGAGDITNVAKKISKIFEKKYENAVS